MIYRAHELITSANNREMEGKPARDVQITEKGTSTEGAELNAQVASPVSPAVELADERAITHAAELDAQRTAPIVPELALTDKNEKLDEQLPLNVGNVIAQ